MHKSALLFGLLLASNSLAEQTNVPAPKYTPTERLKIERLKATHQDATRFQSQRKPLPALPGMQDYKAILHAHAEDSAHTGGTRPEMLADAKKAGVQVIMLSDHLRPPRDFINDSWRGLHDGVLFIPGSEARGFLIYPFNSIMDRMEEPSAKFIATVTASNGLIFLSHIEERRNHSMEGLTGMEIYNRHFDAKKDMAGVIALFLKLLKPEQLAELEESVRLYPDEVLAAQVSYPQEYFSKWDAETQQRRLTGVAANDCHHNQVLVAKMVDENTVLLGTNVDKDEGMRRVTAESQPGIRQLTKGKQKGDVLARVDLDPYFRSFRNATTHILATELTEPAIRSALQQGHAYVSHDWMCDATGFAFWLTNNDQAGSSPDPANPQAQILMGDESKFKAGQKLVIRFPLACKVRLLRNGNLLTETNSAMVEYTLTEPGVYRVEGWLNLDQEDRPWIYSNPIYLR
jgi:hypothetical protein